MIDRFAPNTAALDTPSVAGGGHGVVQAGLHDEAGDGQPRPGDDGPPARRGRRMFQMIRRWASLPRPASAWRHWVTVMPDEPTNRHTTAASSTAASSSHAASRFCRVRTEPQAHLPLDDGALYNRTSDSVSPVGVVFPPTGREIGDSVKSMCGQFECPLKTGKIKSWRGCHFYRVFWLSKLELFDIIVERPYIKGRGKSGWKG